MGLFVVGLVIALAGGFGCGSREDHGAEGDHHDDHALSDSRESEQHDDHAHGEGSDLDRSVEELFAEACEHDVRAHECDDCRYEVGVAKVQQDLITRGLVHVATVGEHSFCNEVELTGEIRFDERRVAHLSPRLPGIIRRVRVDLGQRVSAGETLIEIDSAELAEAEASYLSALADQRLAKRTYDRQRELRGANITSEREYLEAEQQYEGAAIGANSERQKLLRLGMTEAEIAALESAGLGGPTGPYSLKAPFDGEVLELHAVTGEQVEIGSQLVLFGDTRTLWVWVDLYESHLAQVSRVGAQGGLPAAVSVRAYQGEIFPGRVDFIGRTMDEATRTVKARLTLENPEGKLRPGMFARVRLEVGEDRHALAVPAAAVLSDEGRDFVFVQHEDDFYVRRPVKQGRRSEEFAEILSGLEPGQTIVVEGAFLLKSDVLRSKMGAGCAH
jgi:cobalt-zinc-cadmium efflux system membrane fusion protein